MLGIVQVLMLSVKVYFELFNVLASACNYGNCYALEIYCH